MFDRNGTLLVYPTEAELLALLQGDQVNPNLSKCFYTAMLVDAASHGWNKVIEYMVKECGFEVNAHDHKNYTPLGYAAMMGHLHTVQLLVKYGADIKHVRNNAGLSFSGAGMFEGSTALDLAVENGHVEVACYLLNATA